MSEQLEIVIAPDDRLSTPCAPVEKIDEDLADEARQMLDIMYETEGCGLAAPQVGLDKRLVVIDVDYDKGKKNPYVLVNPKILAADGELRDYGEGCLSFPGITVHVKRPSHVVVEARNLDGDLIRYEASENLLAVCLQHEIDHLDGVTMVDHLGPMGRMRTMRAYREALASGAKPGDVRSGADD